ncbi:hypothetical protein EHLJMEHL_00473 [Vreelandella titanicae]
MAKREQFYANVNCPKCSREGHAQWEENENPVYGAGLDRELLSVPKGFELSGSKESNGDPQLQCSKCKVLSKS